MFHKEWSMLSVNNNHLHRHNEQTGNYKAGQQCHTRHSKKLSWNKTLTTTIQEQ